LGSALTTPLLPAPGRVRTYWPFASSSIFSFADLRFMALRLLVSTWLHSDLDAAVLLVAEFLVELGAIFERRSMSYDEVWIDLAIGNVDQQRLKIAMGMCLAHPEGQSLVLG